MFTQWSHTNFWDHLLTPTQFYREEFMVINKPFTKLLSQHIEPLNEKHIGDSSAIKREWKNHVGEVSAARKQETWLSAD